MKCPNCGRKMERHPGFWCCKHRDATIQVPIKKPSKITIGYCANCGQFVQRLMDADVSGLCDECADEELEMIEKAFLGRRTFNVP